MNRMSETMENSKSINLGAVIPGEKEVVFFFFFFEMFLFILKRFQTLTVCSPALSSGALEKK